jgi:hypothetical protein
MAGLETERRNRRTILAGAIGGVAALAARSIAAPDRTDAASAVQLGTGNSETTATVIRNVAGSASAVGLVGRSASTGAIGLQGIAEGSNGKGIHGDAATGSGAMGVYGTAVKGHGVQGYGVIGVVGNGTSWGVYGNSGATNAMGVNASALGSGGVGVKATGAAMGIFGTSTDGTGVRGESTNSYAVYGQNNATYLAAVHGYNTAGAGVHGDGIIGVRGDSVAVGGFGVYGRGLTGVSGDGDLGNGVEGFAAALLVSGVYGEHSSQLDGYGVAGRSLYNGTAVYGDQASGNWAGYFYGNVRITGTLNPASTVMQLDHPDAPAERWYQQALVGAFEQTSQVSGNAVTGPDGTVTVRVPAVFARYHRDVRYLLTALGDHDKVYVAHELDSRGRFTIAADRSGLRISWLLIGLRTDPAATASPLRVEMAKPKRLRGRFAQPALYGQPASRSLLAPPARPRAIGPRRPLKPPTG